MATPKTSTPRGLRSGKSARASSNAPDGTAAGEPTLVRAFCRCTSGHRFLGECCPFDGWSSAASSELAAAVERLTSAGQAVSLASLRQAGVSHETLERTMVIEFGGAASSFEVLDPQGYVVNGEAKRTIQLGRAFK
jgi:hypothetical protein